MINWALKWGCDGTPNLISVPLALVIDYSEAKTVFSSLFFVFLWNLGLVRCLLLSVQFA